MWDLGDPARPTPLGDPARADTRSVRDVACAPDGRTLAGGGEDHAVRLWNVTDPAHAAFGDPWPATWTRSPRSRSRPAATPWPPRATT
ncbi:hypothetical protein ACFTXB_26740 [Streptomyces sp. NPDC057074]|uniref:hypothetical protein n=1 Tax=Streptomyces sp. NPDC057074 TaxID=3346015 RepID=UPI00363D59D2